MPRLLQTVGEIILDSIWFALAALVMTGLRPQAPHLAGFRSRFLILLVRYVIDYQVISYVYRMSQ